MTVRRSKARELQFSLALAEKIREYWTAPERRNKYEYPAVKVVPVTYRGNVLYYEIKSNILGGLPPLKYGRVTP